MLALATLESRMTHVSGFERDQLLLLPEAVDDYVGSDNPVRFIDTFVDGLGLGAAGFLRVEAKAMGRPGYAPGDLLKLYIYGYLNRVRSSRRLETECHRNIEVIWLLRTLSTTRIATSPALRCESSSAAPTSGWKTTSSGSTRATSRMARRGAAHARHLAEKIAALSEKRGRYRMPANGVELFDHFLLVEPRMSV